MRVRRVAKIMSAVMAASIAAEKPAMMVTASAPMPVQIPAQWRAAVIGLFEREPKNVMTATKSTTITARMSVARHVAAMAFVRALNNVMMGTQTMTIRARIRAA